MNLGEVATMVVTFGSDRKVEVSLGLSITDSSPDLMQVMRHDGAAETAKATLKELGEDAVMDAVMDAIADHFKGD